MKQRRFVLLALVALWPSLCALGDPATLHIGSGVAGPCPTGVGTGPCAGIIGGDVLVIPNVEFDVFQQANNSFGFNDLLLITAVPNTTFFFTPEILFATEFNPYTASNGTVLTFSSAADRGAMTNGQNVYDFLGVRANKSDSFANLNAAYAAAFGGTAPTSYEIFTWAIDLSPGFAGNSAIDVVELAPQGSFFLAFGESDKNGSQIITTQFTNTGEVLLSEPTSNPTIGPKSISPTSPTIDPSLQAPEPSSVMMLCIGLGIYGLCKKFVR